MFKVQQPINNVQLDKNIKLHKNISTVADLVGLVNHSLIKNQINRPIIDVNSLKKINLSLVNLTQTVYNCNTNRSLLNLVLQTHTYFWEIKFNLLVTTYVNLEFVGRFRHKIIKSIYNIIFFENTVALKHFFMLWVRKMPLRVHKKFIISLFQNMIFIEFFSYLFYVRFKLLFCVKGKLGLSGDSKKQKHFDAFRPEHKHIIDTGLFYDGIGSASRFGLSFLKINYAQTNFHFIQNHDYIV